MWLWLLRGLAMKGGDKSLTGVTDEGLRYRLTRTPDEAPPIVMEVEPPFGRNWVHASAKHMVGQSFGLRWGRRVLLLRVVGASFNPTTRKLELTCK